MNESFPCSPELSRLWPLLWNCRECIRMKRDTCALSAYRRAHKVQSKSSRVSYMTSLLIISSIYVDYTPATRQSPTSTSITSSVNTRPRPWRFGLGNSSMITHRPYRATWWCTNEIVWMRMRTGQCPMTTQPGPPVHFPRWCNLWFTRTRWKKIRFPGGRMRSRFCYWCHCHCRSRKKLRILFEFHLDE